MHENTRRALTAVVAVVVLGGGLAAVAGAHPTDLVRDPVSTVGHVSDHWGWHNSLGDHHPGDGWTDHPHHSGTGGGHHHDRTGDHGDGPHHDEGSHHGGGPHHDDGHHRDGHGSGHGPMR